MQDCLLANFNVEAQLYLSNGIPHHFYVNRSSYKEFYDRVRPTLDAFLVAYPKAVHSTGIQSKVRLGKP